MSRKRHTEVSWDSDDDLLRDDASVISAFPKSEDSYLESDAAEREEILEEEKEEMGEEKEKETLTLNLNLIEEDTSQEMEAAEDEQESESDSESDESESGRGRTVKAKPRDIDAIPDTLDQSMAESAAKQEAIIQVHPLTELPKEAWKSMKQQQKVIKKRLVDDPDSPIPEGHLRFVCLSDTHSRIEDDVLKVPPGDVLIHAGDFTMLGLPKDIDKFNKYLGTLPHKVKVVIAGNHDLTFDQDMLKNEREDMTFMFGVTEENFETYMVENKLTDVKELMTNCVYLEDASVNIHGINIYGSPWQPCFGGWGFNLPRGQMLLDKWNMIPSDTDILVTHGPPIGHGDYCFDGQRAGCVELLSTIQKRVKPKYHVFGHIHEGYGITSDGYTTYINASTCTLRYKPNNPAVIFDFPLPEGCTKDEALDLCVKPAVKSPTQAQSDEANDDGFDVEFTDQVD